MFISEIFRIDERLIDISKELEKYKDREDIFISFSDYPKLGIYPSSSYDTPIGIYAYPLKEIYQDVVDNTIPFAGNRKFVIVFSANGIIEKDLNPEAENGYSEADWNRDFQRIKEKFYNDFEKIIKEEFHKEITPQKINLQIDNIISNWANNAISFYPGAKFWNVTRNLAEQLSVLKIRNGRPSVIWTAIIRSLGYEGFTDRMETGLIHDNEPCQAVFFSIKNIKLVEILQNIRKKGIDNKLEINNLNDVCNYMNSGYSDNIIKKIVKNIIQLLDNGNCKGVNVPDKYKFKESIKSNFIDLLVSAQYYPLTNEDENKKIILDLLEWYMNHPEIWTISNNNRFIITLFNILPTKLFIHNPRWMKLVMLPKVIKIFFEFGSSGARPYAYMTKEIKNMREADPNSPVTKAYEKYYSKITNT